MGRALLSKNPQACGEAHNIHSDTCSAIKPVGIDLEVLAIIRLIPGIKLGQCAHNAVSLMVVMACCVLSLVSPNDGTHRASCVLQSCL